MTVTEVVLLWAGVVIVMVVGFVASRETPEQKQARLKRETAWQETRAKKDQEDRSRYQAALQQRARTKAAKREKQKEVISKAAASPFAAAGIAAGVTKAAYEHTKNQLGPDTADTFCPRCGQPMKHDDRFCPKCGRPVVEGD